MVHAILGIRAPEDKVGPGTNSQDRMDQIVMVTYRD